MELFYGIMLQSIGKHRVVLTRSINRHYSSKLQAYVVQIKIQPYIVRVKRPAELLRACVKVKKLKPISLANFNVLRSIVSEIFHFKVEEFSPTVLPVKI